MDSSLRIKRDHWLFVRFMKNSNLCKYIDVFPSDMTINQLKGLSNNNLLTIYGIDSIEDRIAIMKAVHEYNVKRIDQSDHESDGSNIDTSLLLRDKTCSRPAQMSRRHSVHRDIFMSRRILRCGSEKMKININNRNSLNKSQNTSLDLPASNLMKIRNHHLGHSAPDIVSSLSTSSLNAWTTTVYVCDNKTRCEVDVMMPLISISSSCIKTLTTL
ncbi:hypothetical protein HELRODRAFT_189029 [Helobdella robusta]|uniref:SAM domain-containing protein n=1 Tax=Helobdella robusta TaxID=6412 RepID=T1FQK7_HELRO|nr:hypothetical protein HELRODRAFT_189029 [Helobdella robusta]ESN99203.1 hypothetical protein HELRODRAFT_189029 [Helobdella robusta]